MTAVDIADIDVLLPRSEPVVLADEQQIIPASLSFPRRPRGRWGFWSPWSSWFASPEEEEARPQAQETRDGQLPYGNTKIDIWTPPVPLVAGSSPFAASAAASLKLAKLRNNLVVLGTGFSVGLAAKLAFAAVAAAITIPAAYALPAAVLVAGVTGLTVNLVRTRISAKMHGTELQAGWWKQAAVTGFILGAAGGSVGAAVANYVPFDRIFHYIIGQTMPGAPVVQHAAQPHLASLPQTRAIAAVARGLHPFTLAGFAKTPDFRNYLSIRMQKLAAYAMHAGNPRVMLHFYKEASNQLLNGRRHTEATRKAGAALVKCGAALARQAGLHDINARMLLRDEAFLNHVPSPSLARHTPLHIPHIRLHNAIAFRGTTMIPGVPPPATDSGNIIARLTSGFGMRFHPILHRFRMHAGVDYGVPEGTPIRAVMAGVVREAGDGGQIGNCVQISSAQDVGSIYGHMEGFAPNIHAGSYVAQGDVIGYAGRTGLATGYHVHFGLRLHNHWVNPIRHIKGGSRALARMLFTPPNRQLALGI